MRRPLVFLAIAAFAAFPVQAQNRPASPPKIPAPSTKVLPPIPSRLLGAALRASLLSLARRTTASVLDDFRASPELRAVLTAQWGDYGLPPKQSSFGIHAVVTSHYFDGAAYPIGGAGQIAESLLPTIKRPVNSSTKITSPSFAM